MKRVCILGYYGHKNFGDELMLEGLRELFCGWDITVMSDNYLSSYPKLDFDLVNQCDLFVLGGGNLINSDRLFSSDLYSFLHSSWVKRVKIPKVILGCGVNFESSNQLKKNVLADLEQFSFIGLRDNFSVNVLQSFPQLKNKVGLFYDPVFAVKTNGATWQGLKDYAVVIPTDRYTNKHDSGVKILYVGLQSYSWLKQRIEPFKKAVFVPFGIEDNNDFQTCNFLSTCTGNSEVILPGQVSLDSILSLMVNCRSVFAYRLHGLLLSFLVGAPYEFYPCHWKLQRVHDTIQGVSLHEIREKQKSCFERVIGGVF